MQNYEKLRERLAQRFEEKKRNDPQSFTNRLNLSWSNWGFGIEDLSTSAKRLSKYGLENIELHGNHYGPSLGYKVADTKKILEDNGLKTAGICGMFSNDNDLSSLHPVNQQEALDYIRREVDFAQEMGAGYLLVVPAVVGRPIAYDAYEQHRSVEALRSVGDVFTDAGVKAAIEPIRSEETTLVHTIAEAKDYIAKVDHPGIKHINGDVFHMQTSEDNISEAILDANEYLVNLHMADSNRLALGSGSMDLDAIIMALYLIDFNQPGRFVTPEPLGAGASPYVARNGFVEPAVLDALVGDSVAYFREREEALVG